MVFFNYATMQMAAKIVYYGPGLCGKTTNLQFIYSKTSPQSRGEMVSLETETDRTLFFDLLPIDVGVIGGFKTRLQLYTVPGQVFYNTTRKLVLKGVDGIVFVADSQMAMLDANVDSYRNLRENLAEIGVDLDEIPLVLQLNKRDLPNIAEPDTMIRKLDPERKYEYVEAIAARGDGVFETLKLISKLTLRTLRRRMTGEEPVKAPPRREFATFRVKETEPSPRGTVSGSVPLPQAAPPPAAPTFATPAASAAAPAAAAKTAVVPQQPLTETIEEEMVEEMTASEMVETTPAKAFADETLSRTADLDSRIIADAPLPETAAPPPPPEPPPPPAVEEPRAEPEVTFSETEKPAAKPPEVKHVKVRSSVDIMAELESLRKRATQAAPAKKKEAGPSAPPPKPKRDLHRTVLIQGDPSLAARAKNVRIAVSFEDESGVIKTHEQSVEVSDVADARSLSIDVKVTLEN